MYYRASNLLGELLLDLLERLGDALDLSRVTTQLATVDKLEGESILSILRSGSIEVAYKLLLCCEIAWFCIKSVEERIEIRFSASAQSLSMKPCLICFLYFVISFARCSLS